MPLIDILERIKKETDEKIALLEKEFKEKKAKLEEDNKKCEQAIDEDMHQKVDEKSKKILEKAKTLAEREGKNMLLQAKRQIIEETLEEAIDKLACSDKYAGIVTDMLKAASLDGENIVVIPAKGKETETKAAIKDSGQNYFLSDKSKDMRGGFILKTDKVEIDNSFETIIKSQLKQELEIKLHKLLFA